MKFVQQKTLNPKYIGVIVWFDLESEVLMSANNRETFTLKKRDRIRSKASSDAYRRGWERIFGKKENTKKEV